MNSPKKIFLDTNILLTDPDSIYKFKDNIVVISTLVLQELDSIKDRKDKSAVNHEARTAIRAIELNIGDSKPDEIKKGVPIKYPEGMKNFGGKLCIMPHKTKEITEIVSSFGGSHTPDEYLVASVLHLQKTEPHIETTLVTLDVNMRLIAASAGVEHVESYRNEKALDDLAMLSEGKQVIIEDDPQALYEGLDADGSGATMIKLKKGIINRPHIGLTFVAKTSDGEIHMIGDVEKITEEADYVVLKDVSKTLKSSAWGIKAKSLEQSLALTALLDENIPLVTLYGGAGTGKTLLALAAGLHLVIEDKQYDKILCVRNLADLDEGIGFLPGTEEEKVAPWLGGITDTLEVLTQGFETGENKGFSRASTITTLMEKAKIQFKALNFFRGKSLHKTLLIVDEGQNLNRHQIKTIVSRVGEGSKVIFLGNLGQIDSKTVNVHNSGLTHLVMKSRGTKLAKAVYLQSVERSELAKFAEEHL